MPPTAWSDSLSGTWGAPTFLPLEPVCSCGELDYEAFAGSVYFPWLSSSCEAPIHQHRVWSGIGKSFVSQRKALRIAFPDPCGFSDSSLALPLGAALQFFLNSWHGAAAVAQ